MKNTFLLIVLLFANVLVYAQDLKTIELPRGARTKNTAVIDGVAVHSYSAGKSIPVNGSPYFNNKFMPGIIELHDERKSNEVLLRYNVARDIFEIAREKDTLILNRPFDVKSIELDNKTFIYEPNFREKAKRNYNGFFQLRVKGELSLYIKHLKEMSFDSFAGNYQGGAGTKEYYYVGKTSYVGKLSDGKPFLIKSKKYLLKSLDRNINEVKAFLKENKIKVKDENDLAQLVEYYNSLKAPL